MSNGTSLIARVMIAALGADYGGRMLVKTDMQTGKSYILTGLFNGRPYNALNDISIDEKGRIYFSDPRYLGHEPIEQDGFAVYRLDPDGSVHRVVTDCGKCNGVLVSPDQKTLYVIGNDNGWFDLQTCRKARRPCRARISCRPMTCLRTARPATAAYSSTIPGRTSPAAGQTAWWPTPTATSGWRRGANGGRASRC
jgi:hypothetical protein